MLVAFRSHAAGKPRRPFEMARRSLFGRQRGRPQWSAVPALPREHARAHRSNPSGAIAQQMRTAVGLFIFRRKPKLGNTTGMGRSRAEP
jgi:hypothetical protein